jgi:hypothetical protein
MPGDFLDVMDLGAMAPNDAKQKALLDAMRARIEGQQQQANFNRAWGDLGMASGDKVLANLGANSLGQAQHQEALASQGEQMSLAKALEARRLAQEQAHQQNMEKMQQQQLEQGRWSLSNPAYGQPYKIDGKTGQIIPVGAPQERPPKGALGEKDVVAQFEKFRQATTPDSVRKLMGQMEASRVRAEELEALIKDPKTGKPFDLTPQNVREAYTMFAQQAQMGGQPAFGQIEHLVPDTLASKYAELKQKYGNVPVGAGAQDFLMQLLESSARNKAVAKAEQGRLIKKAMTDFVDLRKYDRTKYDRMVKSAGFDPALLTDEGDYSEPAPQDAAAPAGLTAEQKADFERLHKKFGGGK